VLSQGEPRDADINFDTYRILQRHRTFGFPATARLSCWLLQVYSESFIILWRSSKVNDLWYESKARMRLPISRSFIVYPWPVHSQGPSEHKPIKNFGKSSRGHTQGLSEIFRASIYRAHCAVIFAIAELSCIAFLPLVGTLLLFFASELYGMSVAVKILNITHCSV